MSCCLCHCCQVSTALLQKQLPANMSGEVGKQKITQVGVGLAQPELVAAIWGVKHRWRNFFSVPPDYHHPVAGSLKQTHFKGGGGGKRGWREHFSQAFLQLSLAPISQNNASWLLLAKMMCRTMHISIQIQVSKIFNLTNLQTHTFAKLGSGKGHYYKMTRKDSFHCSVLI